MGWGVALHVLIGKVKGNNLLQGLDNIRPHGRVRTLVDGQPGCGMGVVEMSDAVFNGTFCGLLCHLGRNVNQFHVL